jgi:anti-anti-sigma regulatory factor
MARTCRMIVRRRDGVPTLIPTGTVDGAAAAEIGRYLEEFAPHTWRLDFSGIQAIDLFAASVLACELKALRSRGMRFEVDGLHERVATILCLGGVIEAVA